MGNQLIIYNINFMITVEKMTVSVKQLIEMTGNKLPW
jgi:hypothetical protein